MRRKGRRRDVAQSSLSGWFVRGDSCVESPPQTGTRSTTELRHGAEPLRCIAS
jgi:hypothetical protein